MTGKYSVMVRLPQSGTGYDILELEM